MEKLSKAKLKAMRDRLAATVPRARARGNTPPAMLKRLHGTFKHVNDLYQVLVTRTANAVTLGEAVDDALIESQMLLDELDAQPTDAPQPLPRPHLFVRERREHERYDTRVVVRLLRHSVHVDPAGAVSLTAATASRPARNVSLGGIFVALQQGELSQVGVGSVVSLDVGLSGEVAPFHARVCARAVVMRRTADGVGLRWVETSDRVRRDIENLLELVRRPSHAAANPLSPRVPAPTEASPGKATSGR
jgi:hypothetical protein